MKKLFTTLLLFDAFFVFAQGTTNEVDMRWWNSLSAEWKTCLKQSAGIFDDINKENISQIGLIRELYCTGIDDFGDEREIISLEPVKRLKHITYLDCSYSSVSDLSPVKHLKKLKVLNCGFTKVKDFSPLRRMSSLEELYIPGLYAPDLKVLSSLRNLRKLDMFQTKGDINTAQIGRMLYLETLHIDETRISDLSFYKEK